MSQSRHTISVADAKRPFFVGIDLGGTNIKVGLVDDLGRTVGFLSVPTHVEQGAEEGAERMGETARQLIAEAGLKPDDVPRAGLGTPGTMDLAAGMLLEPVNLPSWRQFPIRDRVAHHAGMPITYANDAGAAAYGEFWIGSGRELHSMVIFTLGTGVGCGIIIGDLSIDGEHGHGAECGHTIIDYHDDARLCGCGHRGHLEAYASATAVIKRTHEALAAGRTSTLTKMLAGGAELSPLLVGEAAEAGDELSMEIVLETARYLGIGVVTLMHTIDPNGVVLGGGVTFGGPESNLGRRFLERVREEVRRRALPIPAQKTSIEFARLGGDAGYIGAAGLARLEHGRLQSAK